MRLRGRILTVIYFVFLYFKAKGKEFERYSTSISADGIKTRTECCGYNREVIN